jgi:outer membrane protein TolC
MLCNHPQTREVWAAARVQAATLGVARPAGCRPCPVRPGRPVSSTKTRPIPAIRQRSLSWLLYDFGQRSANIENAEQLLQAAAATQDATVQTLFLGALQAYYSAQRRARR